MTLEDAFPYQVRLTDKCRYDYSGPGGSPPWKNWLSNNGEWRKDFTWSENSIIYFKCDMLATEFTLRFL